MLCYAMLCYALLFSTLLYCTSLHCTILHHTIMYCDCTGTILHLHDKKDGKLLRKVMV